MQQTIKKILDSSDIHTIDNVGWTGKNEHGPPWASDTDRRDQQDHIHARNQRSSVVLPKEAMLTDSAAIARNVTTLLTPGVSRLSAVSREQRATMTECAEIGMEGKAR